MSIRIAIPVKLKVDPQAVHQGRADVSQVTQRAVSRILANAERELAQRGGLQNVNFAQLDISWSGDGLKHLSEDDRAALEAELRQVVSDTVDEAVIGPSDPGAPEVLAIGEGVPLDENRLVTGIFVADSYDTSGEDGTPTAPPRREGVQFIDVGEGWAPQDGRQYEYGLYHFLNTADLRRNIRAVLREAIQQGRAPSRGRVAFIYNGPDERGQQQVRAAVIEFNGGAGSISIVDYFNFPLPHTYQYQMDEREDVDVETQAAQPGVFGVGSVRKTSGDADVAEALTALLLSRGEAHMENALRERGATMTPQLRSQIRAVARRFATRNLRNMRDLNPGRPLVLTEITPGNGSAYPAVIPSGPFGDGGAMSIIHLVNVVAADGDPMGEGGGVGNAKQRGGGGQRGGSGGDGGTGTGGGEGEGGAGGGGQPFRFPAPTISNPGETLTCEPFHGEASVDDLGRAGQHLKSLVGRIAWRLQMPECKYPAQFLINAGKVWGGRAAQARGFAAERSATIRATAGDEARSGGLGDIGFEPAPSPVIETIKHLGGTVPLMTELLEAIHMTYRVPENAAKLSGHSQNDGAHFSYALQTEYIFDIQDSIGYGYKVACQSTFIQLCLASRQQILERLNNFENYWPIFDSVLRTLVAEESELRLLRERLESHIATSTDIDMQAAVSRSVDNWRNARRNVISVFSSGSSSAILENAQDEVGDATSDAEIRRVGTEWVIRDRNGKDWTRQELQQSISVRATQGREIDPLLSKLSDLPDVRRIAMEAPEDAKEYIRALLNEMLEDNEEVTREVEADAHHAFTRGQISEDLVNPTVRGINVRLGGIHLVAHEAIYDSFRGDPLYESALRKIFGLEVGKAELLMVIEFVAMVGIVAVSVVCPPLGIAAGAVMAGINYGVAHENAEVTNALFNPEEVTSSASAELELFMGEIEVVMSLIPFAGKALGATLRGGRAVVQQGARQAGRSAFRGMTRQLASEIAENMRDGIARQVLREILQDQVSGKLMEQVLAPVMQQVVSELELARGNGPGAPQPADQSLSQQNPQDAGMVQRRTQIVERKFDEAGGNIDNNSEGADAQRGSDGS